MAALFQQAINVTSVLLATAASTSTSLLSKHQVGNASTTGSDLYAGVDLSSLNYPEQLWVKWYLWFGNPVIATGVMSFLLHEIFYFGRCIPWMIIGQIRAFDKYKLQQAKVTTAADQWKCTKYVLSTHFTVQLPQIWSFHPIAEYFGMATHTVPFPSWTTMAYQIAIFFVFEDCFHYWAHRALHQGQLYKKIHKLHHEFSAPFGLAAEYAHPLEILILGMGTIAGPLLWCLFTKGNLHVMTMYIWIILRLFQAVDAHSGYDFPWSLRHIVPFWSGADHHDYHHEKFVGCYSTSFRWMDHLFGTDKAYKEYRKKQELQKNKGSKEQ
ncbi:hypothetical protein CROQUDRAFT_656029 [Cronartium quercuum f. sp. fusiforme G11]|uniref:Fatty acid hydroxylase domain-containing protein n=1 Tax=Cronartium quercuum f. sp. fusiforme G11 TaxID=708437 RepID=A0A9P6NNP0_9BASI|nr:hypothetical protein CROQUDRAFT_656029 [Cronartium quercuum f. sp. fusiforme G11]